MRLMSKSVRVVIVVIHLESVTVVIHLDKYFLIAPRPADPARLSELTLPTLTSDNAAFPLSGTVWPCYHFRLHLILHSLQRQRAQSGLPRRTYA